MKPSTAMCLLFCMALLFENSAYGMQMGTKLGLKNSVLHIQKATILKTIPSRNTKGILPIREIERIELTQLDNKRLIAADERRLKPLIDGATASLFYGRGRNVSINTMNSGTWEWLDDGSLLWRQILSSPGAHSISLGITRYRMPEGGEMYVYTPDRIHVRGPFTHRDNQAHGQLWTPIVPGDEVVVEIVLPERSIEDVDFEITRLVHDYRGAENGPLGSPHPLTAPPWNPLGTSLGCHVDVECIGNNTEVDNALPSGVDWNNNVRSVGLMYIYSESSAAAGRCTATLINNTATDGKAYILTAYHCIDPEGELKDHFNGFAEILESISVYWNFVHDQCRDFEAGLAGGNGGTIPTDYTVGGATLVSRPESRDIVVLELNNVPDSGYNLYYSGWDRTGDTPSTGVSIHHAKSDVKRLAIDTAPSSNTDVDWDIGTTEMGSSGGPLFNQQGNATGVLAYQWFASCENAFALFSPIDGAWDKPANGVTLSSALDPEGLGFQHYDGIDADDLVDCRVDISHTTNSFADVDGCVIVTGPYANFGTGVPPSTVRLHADRYIRMKSGTHVRLNTDFHAYIN